MPRFSFAVIFLVVAVASSPLLAQEQGECVLFADIFTEELRTLAFDLTASGPETSPQSEQKTAPSGVDPSVSLVNGASFPELLAFALDSGFLTEQDDVLTGNFNLFDLKAAFQPDVLDLQSLYQTKTNQNLRRWGLALTLGGKGESFDRDGDGAADPVLEAKALDDIVNWEVRYRIKGTRDRRDAKNVNKFMEEDEAQRIFDTLSQHLADFETLNRETIRGFLERRGDSFCVRDPASVRAFLKRPDIAAQLEARAGELADLKVAIDDFNEEIDGSFIVTAVVGGLDRKDEFGSDKRMAGIRAAKGLGKDKGGTLNLEYTETRALGGVEDPTMWKLGLEYSLLALKGSLLGESGIKVALSGAYEMYDHVQTAKHDTIAKLNAKFDIPLRITDVVKIPVSITWANHKDLLEDEEEIRGHIGFTVDLTKMNKFITDSAAFKK